MKSTHLIRAHERAELEREAREYMLTALLVIAALVLLSTLGHAWVSRGMG